jgi:hypothetical protein
MDHAGNWVQGSEVIINFIWLRPFAPNRGDIYRWDTVELDLRGMGWGGRKTAEARSSVSWVCRMACSSLPASTYCGLCQTPLLLLLWLAVECIGRLTAVWTRWSRFVNCSHVSEIWGFRGSEWVVAPCCLVRVYRRFSRSCYIQSDEWASLMEA